MQVVIIYESLTGNTERVAWLIADEYFRRGVDARIFPVAAAEEPEVVEAIAQADLVILGSWTDGIFVVGQRPAKGGRFAKLPNLQGKRCVVFCTYALNPGRTLDKFTKRVEGLGGQVLGGLAIRRNQLEEGARDFVARLDDVVPA
ncbi:MAG: flavodoxin domain-containing protein [Acidimicrobiales bacterium]|jgi:flavorubredoxin|nr:flavodoxin domain-containing protein [Acidimicrobiales bacterium]